MSLGSFAQILPRSGGVPSSLLPSIARVIVHALKQLHALKHVSKSALLLLACRLILRACTQRHRARGHLRARRR
jgi:hypothetical protein